MSDIQIPPEEEQEQEQESGRSGIGARLIPWLILLALGLLFLPLYLGASTIDESTTPLSTEFMDLVATMTAPPPVPIVEQTLTTQLLDLRGVYGELNNLAPNLVAGHMDWPAIMNALHSYDANRIRLTSFSHDNGHLTLNGDALEESAVLDYAHAMEQTAYFANVQVQSITVNPVAPATLAPSGTPTPGPTIMTETYMPFVFVLSLDLVEAGNGSR